MTANNTTETAHFSINCGSLVQTTAEVLTKSWRLSWRHIVWHVVGKGVSVHQVRTKYQHRWEERQQTTVP